MAFPDAPRVIYRLNPLDEVICQLRFPPVLKIDVEPPAAFQDRIRTTYPLYKVKPTLAIPAGLPAELASLLTEQINPGGGQKAHEFSSKDGAWTIALTRDFIALTCRRYDRWETFKEHLHLSLDALHELYAPAFFTRIGLRYRDVIRRSTLGLHQVDWADLLQPWVAGAFASRDVVQDIERSAHELLVRLPDQRSRTQVHHGLIRSDADPEPCYIIDADFFDDQQTETAHAFSRLDFLNHQARLFFRWCIKDGLHEAMGPELLSGA